MPRPCPFDLPTYKVSYLIYSQFYFTIFRSCDSRIQEWFWWLDSKSVVSIIPSIQSFLLHLHTGSGLKKLDDNLTNITNAVFLRGRRGDGAYGGGFSWYLFINDMWTEVDWKGLFSPISLITTNYVRKRHNRSLYTRLLFCLSKLWLFYGLWFIHDLVVFTVFVCVCVNKYGSLSP